MSDINRQRKASAHQLLLTVQGPVPEGLGELGLRVALSVGELDKEAYQTLYDAGALMHGGGTAQRGLNTLAAAVGMIQAPAACVGNAGRPGASTMAGFACSAQHMASGHIDLNSVLLQ